jgi:hypothetical protein
MMAQAWYPRKRITLLNKRKVLCCYTIYFKDIFFIGHLIRLDLPENYFKMVRFHLIFQLASEALECEESDISHTPFPPRATPATTGHQIENKFKILAGQECKHRFSLVK